MKRLFFALFVLLLVAIELEAATCFPWKSDGIINVCTAANKKGCSAVGSRNTCKNLTKGGPYKYGHTSRGSKCAIYSGLGCKSSSNKQNIGSTNVKFYFTAKSIKCSCV
ncbi:CLUMA_CG019070, isoform A [Clunio marinus]|uniref:CLUMA_CG019070, isoform A n=1 Tax=Clunio marinus TaxID=568069 RepID=A0A1J1J181_9DIPT|nr:CLUMA_CG019070, isoform A [Clunio marinus]